MNVPLWRDVSIVLLALESFALGLFPLAVLYFASKWLRHQRGSVQPVFSAIRVRVQQVEVLTLQVAEVVVSPIIASYALAARLRRVVRTVVGLPRGGV